MQQDELKTYNRTEISDEDQGKMAALAVMIAMRTPTARITSILTILRENAMLAREVNTHRAELGYELLPLHDPMKGAKNGKHK